VVTYATSDDAYGLLKSAIRDNNPVIFLEAELTYGVKGEVPDEEYTIPIGKARIRGTGSDVTIVTWGKQVFNVENAVKTLNKQGVSVDFIDLRSLRPLDEDALYRSVAKTGRCVVVHEGHLFAGVGAEIAARLQEVCFDHLQAPVLRVTNRDVPQPYATNLEKAIMPNPQRIVDAVNRVLGR
jgi:pyruvate dehydrogenase E1 component beta subunit